MLGFPFWPLHPLLARLLLKTMVLRNKSQVGVVMAVRGGPATRVIVISDLHLGGAPPCMMSHTEPLEKFLRHLPTPGSDEALELVIAGDFVDFLAIPPEAAWTPDPAAAHKKLEEVMYQSSPCAPIFAALEEFVAAGHRLTVMVGNHDVEMGLPPVQEAFLRRIGAARHQVVFVDDGRAHQIGEVLIEHGNRYDDANRNDWTGLRAIASALSRREKPSDNLKVSAGSRIVEKVVCALKGRYPFIDLLQPQGELVALLLFAFEPSLLLDVDKIARVLRGGYLQNRNAQGLQPGRTRYVANRSADRHDPKLVKMFPDFYRHLRGPGERVGLREWIGIARARGKDGLWESLGGGKHLPRERLEKIRLVLRRLLLDDKSARLDGPAEQYGKAARRIIKSAKGDIKVVVMGHTHLARRIEFPEGGTYINTGTWADIIRVPSAALADGERADMALEAFLLGLKQGRGRTCVPTYADLRIEADGRASRAQLLHATVD